MPTMNTIVEAVREAQSDTQKTASSNQEPQEEPEKNSMSKEAELLDGVIGENQLEKMAEDEISKAAEYAEKGREMLRQEVRKVAEERKRIADEHGEEKLADLDKAAAAEQYGREMAREAVESTFEKNAAPNPSQIGQQAQELLSQYVTGPARSAGQQAMETGQQAMAGGQRAVNQVSQAADQYINQPLTNLGGQMQQGIYQNTPLRGQMRNMSQGQIDMANKALGYGAAGTGAAGASYGASQLAKESSFEKVAEEYGEDKARDMMKASHFDQAGRELAHLAVQSGLEKNAAPNPSQIGSKAQELLSQYLGQPAKQGLNQAGEQLGNLGRKVNNQITGTGKEGLDNLRAIKNKLGIEDTPAGTEQLDKLVGGGAVGAGAIGTGGAAYGASQLAQ